MRKEKSQKTINFIKAYRKTGKSAPLNRITVGITLSLFSMVIILGGFYGYLYFKLTGIDASLTEIKNYIGDESVISQYSKADENQNTVLAQLIIKRNSIAAAHSAVSARTVLGGAELTAFLDCGDGKITLKGLTYNNAFSALSFEAYAADPADISDYIDKLNSLGIFRTVNYDGYSLSDNSQYRFYVQCYMKAVEADE